jgi:hypothetical protein
MNGQASHVTILQMVVAPHASGFSARNAILALIARITFSAPEGLRVPGS